MVVVKNIAPLDIKPIYISWPCGNCSRNCINVATLLLHSRYTRENGGVIIVDRIITYDRKAARCTCCIWTLDCRYIYTKTVIADAGEYTFIPLYVSE